MAGTHDLPLFNSYQQYKDDTEKVATWLARNARKCGYPADLLTRSVAQKRPQTISRSRSNQAGSSLPDNAQSLQYTIKVKDYTSLAEYIVSCHKPRVQVPSSFVSVLDRAITVRKRYASWWQGQIEDEPGENGHAFFIGVLEKTRSILRTRFAEDARDQPYDEQAEGSKPSLVNLFANLAVDEPSEELLLGSEAPATKLKGKVDFPRPLQPGQGFGLSTAMPRITLCSKVDDTAEIYTPAIEARTDEMMLAAHMLFNDFSQLRNYLHQIWYDYGEEAADLITVAVTTNSALDLARRAAENFEQQFPERSLLDIIKVFYVMQCQRKQQPFKKPMNFEMYEDAEPLLLPAYILLASFQDVITPGRVPIYKPGSFGKFDWSVDRDSKTNEQKFTDDKIVLGELLQDFAFVARTSDVGPTDDEVIRGFRQMVNKKQITVGFLFATQVFLDIYHIFGPNCNALYDLQQSGRKIHSSLSHHFEFHKDLKIDNWPAQNDQVLRDLMSVIDRWVLRDIIGAGIDKVRQQLGQPSTVVPFQLLQHHPIFCGLLAFHINMRAQEAGLSLANAWGSILNTAHLYNAMTQQGEVTRPWPDMDFALSTQNPSQLFVGSPPSNYDDYLKRFLLSMGHSAQVFASNRRDPNPEIRASTRGPRSLNSNPCDVCEIFRPRYCNHAASIELTEPSVRLILDHVPEAILNFLQVENSAAEQQSTRAAKRRARRTLRLSNLQLLDCLFLAITAEIDAIKFDFLELHRNCWAMLKAVQNICHPRLLRYYEPGYLETESQLPFTVGYIFMTASASQQAAQSILKPKQLSETTSIVFETAADVMELFLKEDKFSGKSLMFLRHDVDEIEAMERKWKEENSRR